MRNLTVIGLLIIALAGGGVDLGLTIVQPPDAGVAVLAGAAFASICLAIVARERDDRQFLIRLFLLALCLRWVTGFALLYLNLPPRIAPDFATYDYFGDMLC